jgi:PAS domain-containing protein
MVLFFRILDHISTLPHVIGIGHSARRATPKRPRALNPSQLDGLITSAMDAIVMVDEKHEIIVFYPAAEKMFRYKLTEVT